jgi:hypothetical protein
MDVFRDKQNVFFYVKEIIEKRFDFLATILNDKISNEPIITYLFFMKGDFRSE